MRKWHPLTFTTVKKVFCSSSFKSNAFPVVLRLSVLVLRSDMTFIILWSTSSPVDGKGLVGRGVLVREVVNRAYLEVKEFRSVRIVV